MMREKINKKLMMMIMVLSCLLNTIVNCDLSIRLNEESKIYSTYRKVHPIKPSTTTLFNEINYNSNYYYDDNYSFDDSDDKNSNDESSATELTSIPTTNPTSPVKILSSVCPISTAATSQMQYHFGKLIMLNTAHIYIIWYGSWSTKQHLIIHEFLDNLSNSNWLNIQTTYYQIIPSINTKQYASASIVRVNESTDNYSQGTLINNSMIQTIITNQFNSNTIPIDIDGIYFVLTSSDVNLNGFCTTFCGYHNGFIYQKKYLKYAWIGNPVKCGGRCWAQSIGPNDDSGMFNL